MCSFRIVRKIRKHNITEEAGLAETLSGGSQFESRPGRRSFYLKMSVVLLSHSRKMSGQYPG
jgi:hypothetical protein